MSTIKADTIVAADGSSPVTLTKQEAVKHYVNYDATAQVTETSLNQSSLTDQSAGVFYSTFTNSFNDKNEKVHFVSNHNGTDPTTTGSSSGGTRGGTTANVGTTTSGGSRPHATTEVQFWSCYGAASTHNGAPYDFGANYICTIGDLA